MLPGFGGSLAGCGLGEAEVPAEVVEDAAPAARQVLDDAAVASDLLRFATGHWPAS
jgi:hypothetical protein